MEREGRRSKGKKAILRLKKEEIAKKEGHVGNLTEQYRQSRPRQCGVERAQEFSDFYRGRQA